MVFGLNGRWTLTRGHQARVALHLVEGVEGRHSVVDGDSGGTQQQRAQHCDHRHQQPAVAALLVLRHVRCLRRGGPGAFTGAGQRLVRHESRPS
ncbi:hypothetical protein SDC9_159970 [bioreactor metagenome]|uniref:Uncharacterized protein n=1 Tax=bioreactor metagenome TaxID=1076179 RepID=A0A645FE41_9ZZZZ